MPTSCAHTLNELYALICSYYYTTYYSGHRVFFLTQRITIYVSLDKHDFLCQKSSYFYVNSFASSVVAVSLLKSQAAVIHKI